MSKVLIGIPAHYLLATTPTASMQKVLGISPAYSIKKWFPGFSGFDLDENACSEKRRRSFYYSDLVASVML